MPSHWLHVATSATNLSLELPKIGYLHELLWLTVEDNMVVRKSETKDPPILLQTIYGPTVVEMSAGELWMRISDVEKPRGGDIRPRRCDLDKAVGDR